MRATVRSDGGLRHAVEVDGVDVSKAITSATVWLNATEPASVSLEVSLPVLEILGAEAEVIVSGDARDLLIAAGWTPPSG